MKKILAVLLLSVSSYSAAFYVNIKSVHNKSKKDILLIPKGVSTPICFKSKVLQVDAGSYEKNLYTCSMKLYKHTLKSQDDPFYEILIVSSDNIYKVKWYINDLTIQRRIYDKKKRDKYSEETNLIEELDEHTNVKLIIEKNGTIKAEIIK